MIPLGHRCHLGIDATWAKSHLGNSLLGQRYHLGNVVTWAKTHLGNVGWGNSGLGKKRPWAIGTWAKVAAPLGLGCDIKTFVPLGLNYEYQLLALLMELNIYI